MPLGIDSDVRIIPVANKAGQGSFEDEAAAFTIRAQPGTLGGSLEREDTERTLALGMENLVFVYFALGKAKDIQTDWTAEYEGSKYTIKRISPLGMRGGKMRMYCEGQGESK